MYRNTALAFSLCSLAYTGQAQSYGLLVGGYHTDLRAAGEVFAPGTGVCQVVGFCHLIQHHHHHDDLVWYCPDHQCTLVAHFDLADDGIVLLVIIDY